MWLEFKVDQHISDLSSVIPTLKSHLSMVETATNDEESAGLENYRYQHMAHIAPESRLLAKQGLKLKVMLCYSNEHTAAVVCTGFAM